jgi:anaerobic selenocysteine-containing dehydrogenase
MDDRYRGVFGTRHVIFLHPDDIAQRKLRDGDIVDITSHTLEDGLERTITGFRIVTYDIPRGCAAGYFPEMNPLVSAQSFADRSKTPLSKFIPVTVVKARS